MRKEVFEKDHFYHVYCMGTEKRPIFLDDREKLRFVNSIYVLNNFLEIPRRFNIFTLEPRELLVPIKPYIDVVAGCLMPNHYHSMMTPLRKDGVSLFQHKLGTSYTKYFNIKHERSGRLFASTFRAKHVDRKEYAVYLTQYIHLNPAKLFLSQAKLGTDEVLDLVEKYEWSSLPDYLGKKSKFSIALSPNFHKFRDEILGIEPKFYRKFLRELFTELSQA